MNNRLQLILMTFFIYSCQPVGVNINDLYPSSKGLIEQDSDQIVDEQNGNRDEVNDNISGNQKLPFIKPGVAIGPEKLIPCSEYITEIPADLCMALYDSFERENLTGSQVFSWDMAIMDYGLNGQNVDAKIKSQDFLGPVISGEKAVIFAGREGGSTHEVYLVSRSLDFSEFEQVYIQFWYLPIKLEYEIQLHYSSEKIPESIRLDICNGTDTECGLAGNNLHLGLRDKNFWDRFFINPTEFGEKINLRNYVLDDWKLAQFVIDIEDYHSRADNFVFKIAAAMDEGFKSNNWNMEMEDGILLDEVIVIGLKGSQILNL